jgi:hypothetical protein
MYSKLASVTIEEKREDEKMPSVDGVEKFRVYYRLEDDMILPTYCHVTVVARTQERAAKAVKDRIEKAVPIYVEDFKLGEMLTRSELLEKHGHTVQW